MIFLLNNWKWIALAVAAAVLVAWGSFWKWQAGRWEDKYIAFVAQTEALGKQAELKAKETEAKNKKAKEVADARNEKTITALRADNQRLRDEHSRSSLVPGAAPGSASPETVTFYRAELGSALRRFEAGVENLLGEGDEAIEGLNTAREWAQR